MSVASGARDGPVAVSALLCAVALVYVAAYLGVALARMTYPFELEWIEAGMLEGARRVSIGEPLYAAPSLEYVAFNYTPLYPVLAAPLVSWLGTTLLPLRLLSFVASLGCLAAIFMLVARETRSRLAGVLAAGLFAACYRRGGAWLDIARPDSLYLLFLLSAMVVLALDRSRWRGPVSGGVLLALAYLTKQSALVVALPIFAYFAWRDRPRLIGFAAAFLGLAGAASVAWDVASGGWFRYYAFAVAGRHAMSPALIPLFWTSDLLPALPIALVLGVLALTRMSREPAPEPSRDRPWFYAACLSGLFFSSWWLRCFTGGYQNVLMTAHAAIAIAFGFGCAQWLAAPATTRRGTVLASVAVPVILAQFAWLAYDPRHDVPGAEEIKRGHQLIQIVSSVPGEVLAPSHVALTPMSGKPRHFHSMAMTDVLNDPGPTGTRVAEELGAALRGHRYALVLLNQPDPLLSRVLEHYQIGARVSADTNAFWLPTGMRTRPQYLMVPRSP